ncbi:MAG: VOC family protein [Chloroflexota bacterium]
MISHVGTVSIFVHDQDRAKDFYANKLGFEVRSDVPLFPGVPVRWLAVAPPDAQTDIILYLADDNWDHYKQTIGKAQSLTLSVPDIAATAAQLKANGVNFIQEPDTQFWGTYAMIEDSEGNHLMLVQVAANDE